MIINSYLFGLPPKVPVDYGDIINQDFSVVSNLTNYTVTNPSSTWSISGGTLNTSSSVVGGFTEFITFNGYGTTLLDRWTQTINFKHTFNASSIGLTAELKTTNTYANDVYQAFVATYSGGEGVLTLFKNGVSVATDTTVFTGCSSTDSWRLTMSRDFGSLPTYTATVENITTAQSNSCTYTSIDMNSTTYLTNTACKFAIGNQGGDTQISSWKVNSTAKKEVDICFIGYSIDEGFNSGGYANAWTAQAMSGNSKSYTKLCSQSGYSQTFLDAINEITTCNAYTYVIGGCLGNDKLFAVADGTADANYASLVSQIKAACPLATVIHIKESPRNGFSMVPVNARRVTLAGTDTIVDLYTPVLGSGTSINATYDSDGTHLNAAGHALEGSTMQPYLV